MKNLSYDTLRKLHPCLSEEHGQTGRIHLPVSPSCNLACRYCHRSLTSTEERPGTASRILAVDEVVGIVQKARELCPQLTTVGIAGPGEALATPHAIEAFRLVDRHFPDMIKCLSTNGLLLPEKAEELAEVHMDSITVTVNSVDPAVQKEINGRIFYHGEWIIGEEAARIQIQNQLEGIRRVSELAMTVKINIVLIPGINDACVGETSRAAAEAGARLCNIIPLIPQAEMTGRTAPGCAEIERARADAGKYLDIFRHCRHCRADAAGTLGGVDIGRQLYGDRTFEKESFSHG